MSKRVPRRTGNKPAILEQNRTGMSERSLVIGINDVSHLPADRDIAGLLEVHHPED
jgi:hypothetical protein